MLQVVQQFLEKPGVGGVANALVTDQYLCLVRHLGPGEVPQRDLVRAPPVDLHVDQRTPLQGHVVRQGDHGFVATPGGDVHIVLDLLGFQRIAVGLRLQQGGPELACPLDPDHAVRPLREVAVRKGHLCEGLHTAGRGTEGRGESAPELGHLGHHRQQNGRRAGLTFPVVSERRGGEEPSLPP